MLTDLNDILLFAQVARSRSFTGAARVLAMPKSTVSRRLAQLEAALGQRLLERTTRQVTLTDAGAAWAEHAERVLAEVDSARGALDNLARHPQGVLKLAMPVEFAIYWLATPLASFAARYPAITLDLDLAPREVDVIGERFDAAIRIGDRRDSTLVARRIATIARSVYASPLYLADRPAPHAPADLATHRMLAFPSTRPAPLVLTSGRRRAEVALSATVRANSIGMQRALALAGAGIAVLPDVLCATEVAAGRLVRVLPDWQAEATYATLVMPSRRYVPAKVKLLIEHLYAHLA